MIRAAHSVKARKRQDQRGYILITTALLLVGLIGVAGLSVDIGRMYIARNEAQTFADAAAIAAALELDGSSFAISNARNAALSVVKRYDLQTKIFTDTEVYFGTSSSGPWNSNPASPSNVRYARVIARTMIPIFFIPVAGTATNAGSSAVAAAGQDPQSSFGTGLFPMTPFAADENAVNAGLIPGQIYALRWGSNDNKLNQLYNPTTGAGGGACPGDFAMGSQRTVTLATGEPSSRRGYYAPFHSSSEQRHAIISDDTGGVTIAVGSIISPGPGGHNSNGNAIQSRLAQDTDPTSTSYTTYQSNRVNGRRAGNGRRIIGVPINSGRLGTTPYEVIAIGSFFLLTSEWYDANGNQPLCAEFIGPWVQGSKNTGGSTSGSYVLRLTE